MRARAELTAGRRLRMVEDPPIAFRETPDGVYQVGTAGGPVGDDDLGLRVTVEAGHRIRMRSVAATVVYAGTGTRQAVDIDVEAGAQLDWVAPPVIATAGCRHRQDVVAHLAGDARLDLTEVLLVGRHGEDPGRLHQRLVVDVDGIPLVRHELVVGAGAPGWDGPAVLAGHRAVGLRLVAGPAFRAPATTSGEGWAWCRLEGPGWLLVATAADLPDLQRAMACAAATPPR